VMFKQLAMVVGFSLTCSLVAAITLVPMLSARWLRGNGEQSLDILRSGRTLALLNRWGAKLDSIYRTVLRAALDHRWITVGAALLLVLGAALLAPRVGTELMPETDEGEVRLDGDMEIGTRLEVVSETFLEVERIVRAAVPELDQIVVSIGGSLRRGSGSHNGQARINLKPRSQRRRSSAQVADDLRRRLAQVPGVSMRVRAGQGLFIMRMGTSGGDRLAVEIRGHDFETAQALAERVQAVVAGTPGVTDTIISREAGMPERRILIDRRKAADLGVTVDDIATVLETVLGGASAGYFRQEGDQHRILVQAVRAEFLPLEEVLDVVVINRAGSPVVLRNVVDIVPSVGPSLVERRNQERIINVTGEISGRDLGSVIADVRAGLSEVPVPSGFEVVFVGDYEEQQKSFRELVFSLILAIVLVYMVMACQFESLRDPLVVIFAVPLAAIGVVTMLFLTGTTFNVQSFIGCIMLAGIVVNNAILLVDQANLLRRRDGLSLRAAVEEAGRRRLRPIFMTALTTMLGLTPMALGMGEGGEAQAPMARAVIGGLLSATMITLVFIPAVYLALEQRRERRHAA
ncbi:MAG: efflux RND transporter permease subunit, partial [Kiritimatiellia bacterium]